MNYGSLFWFMIGMFTGIVISLTIDHLVDKYLDEVRFLIGKRKE